LSGNRVCFLGEKKKIFGLIVFPLRFFPDLIFLSQVTCV
jgi:hypothetical protein